MLQLLPFCFAFLGEKKKDGENRPLVVEATGLEPAASWSQTKRDTKLRHASIARTL